MRLMSRQLKRAIPVVRRRVGRWHVVFLLVLGVSGLLPVHAQTPIKIGAVYALSGAAAEANAESVRGVRMAVDILNRRGGLLGRPIDVLVLDNQSTPIGSYVAAEQAAEAGVVALIGADWSSHSLQIAKVAQDKQIPMISSYSTHPDVTGTGDYIFRICFTDTFVGKVMAHFAHKDLKARTALVVTDLSSEYSIALSNIFKQHFTGFGGLVVGEIEYKLKQINYDRLLQSAGRTPADVMFLSGHDESAYIGKLVQQAGLKVIPLGGDGWSTQAFMDKGGKDLQRGYFCTHWSPSVKTAASRNFMDQLSPALPPNVGTALAYDAVMVLSDAIKRAGTVDKNIVRDHLARTTGYKGVTGKIAFNTTGDPVKSAVIMEIRNGKRGYLKTLEPF